MARSSISGGGKAVFLVGVLGAISLSLSTIAEAAPTARLAASRTSGPAPLAVFFDATGSTDSNSSVDTFRQLGYRFTFGDAGSGSWEHSGRSRNEQVGGPLAAHVFNQPGTYSVQVAVRDAAGATSTATTTVTVTSPEAAFPGARTVCLSRNSDFGGCPSGAQQLSNASSWPAFASGTRYLLRRGQDFTSLGNINFGSSGRGLSDSQLGAFGAGNKPIVNTVTIQSSGGPEGWAQRVAVMDLDARNITQVSGATDVLILRNTVNRGGMIDFASAFDYWLSRAGGSTWRNPENIFLVDNVIDRNFDAAVADNPSAITGNAVRLAIMGNNIDRTVQHNVRIWQAHKAVIAHNRITGHTGSSIRHVLKLHSSGLNPVAQSLQGGVAHRQRSSQIIIADNQIGSPNSNINWLAVASPQNDSSAEGLEDVIWEDNQFRHGSNYVRDITWAGRRMTERGNRNVSANRAANYGVGHHAGLPADWNGPYYSQQPSIKPWFTGSVSAAPQSPTGLVVQ